MRSNFIKKDTKKMPVGPLDWIKLLKKITDEELKDLTGTDAALYLIFLRYTAVFYFVMLILSIVITIPVYISGNPLHYENAYH